MAIHAHPDDQEFTVAGTLAKWARAGCAITTVRITRGDAGSNEKTHPNMIARIHEEEQRNACKVLDSSMSSFCITPTAFCNRHSNIGVFDSVAPLTISSVVC